MAHSIAAQNGLPKCIVERANKVQNNDYQYINYYSLSPKYKLIYVLGSSIYSTG